MAKQGPKKPKRRVLLEELEPRILFSAGIEGLPLDTVVFDDHALVQPYEEPLRSLDQQSAAAAEETRHELVVVDAATPDYQTLVDDITARADSAVEYDVVVLEAERDGITQLSEILADRQDLDAVHVISHGSDGSIALGDTELRFDTLVQNASSISAWGEAFSEDGDLLLYGCDLAATEAGQSLVDALGRLTGADVAASEDLTGHASLGGDWDLEYRAGEIETEVAVDSQAQSDYAGLLANELWYTEKSSFPVEEYTPTTLEPVTGVTSGSMASGFDIQSFTGSGKEVWATHYVTQSVTVGTGSTFTVQQGDLLLSMEGVSTLTGTNGDITVDKGDVVVFRPTTAGDYSSGSFHMLLDGLGGTNEILGLSLVERDITVGGQFLAEGSVLYSVKNGSASQQIQHVTAIDAGATTTLNAPTLFLDGAAAGMGIDNDISGIHLVQSDLSIGDTSLTAGQLLMSLVANDTVGNNGVNVTKSDIFILDISSSTLADATLLFEGVESGSVVDDVRSIALFVENDAPVLSGANDLTAIDEDDFTNGGTLVSDLLAGQVSDADGGALEGIAVIAVDDTNGSWEYTTDGGSSWTAFGAVDASTARLLAADADTSIRFVPDANWNGTVTNGLTFHAWDQTSGTTGGTADLTNTDSVLDQFTSASYANDHGSQTWSTNWVESDSNGGGASSGFLQITGGELQITADALNDSIYRQADLSGATTATLTFDYRSELGTGDIIFLQVSANGGGSYTTVETFSNSSNTGTGSITRDISAYIASDTRIRFIINDAEELRSLYIDNVQIEYGAGGVTGGATAFSTASASSDIIVNAYPINNLPAAQTTAEDTTITFNSANGNLISVTDTPGDTLTVTLSVDNGWLTLSQTTGLTFDAGADGSATMTVTGTVDDINAALNGLQYLPSTDYNGADTLTLTSRNAEIYSLEIDSNLIGRYEFNAAAPGDDSSPGGTNDATLVGNATITTDAEHGDVLSLDGNGDYAEITGNFGNPANVTLAAWVNLTAADTQGSDVINVGDNVGLRLDNPNGGSGVWAYYYDGTTWNNIASGQFVAGDGWVHVAYVFDDVADTHTIYINGTAINSEAATSSISYANAPNTRIGSHANGSTDYDFNGLIDDARVYTRALTASEIATLANAPVQSSDSDSVAITVNAVNDAPLQVNNSGDSLAQGGTEIISNSELRYDDPEQAPANVTYSITTAPTNGQIELTTGPGVAINSFTQAQIDAGLVVYVHDGSASTTDSFEFDISDGVGGTLSAQTFSLTIVADSGQTLWITPEQDVAAPSGWNGITGEAVAASQILSLGGPNLALEPGTGTTDGSFTRTVDFAPMVVAGSGRVNALHVVGSNMTVGTNAISLQTGDVLFSLMESGTHTLQNSDLTTTDVQRNDIVIFRPDSPGDYTSGTYSILVDGADLGFNALGAFTLVEQATTVGQGGGATTLDAGDILLVDWNNTAADAHIQRLQPGTLGDTTTGTLSVLVDGNDLSADLSLGDIVGLDLVEQDTAIGGTLLRSGQILLTLYGGDDIGGTTVAGQDIVVCDVTTTGANSAGTASLLFDGSDVGLDVWQEDIRGLSLAPSINLAPEIISDGGAATASINVAENTTAVTTVAATDLNGDTPTFSITGGADQTLFSIDTNTGALTFDSAPDFEAPTDSDGDNVYVVQVTASDGNGGTDVQTISVTVTNESDSTALWLSTDENVGAPGADGMSGGWTESDVLEFSGSNLTHGATTDGELSHVIDFSAFTTDSVDAGALHYVNRDLTVGSGSNTFDLQVGDVLVSFLQDETVLAAYTTSGSNETFLDNDLLVFRPTTPGDYSDGTFHLLLDDVVPDDLKGMTFVEQGTTIGGTDVPVGSFLIIQETSATTSVDLFIPDGVGEGTTSGTTTPLIDLSNLGIDANRLRGIELIERETTIGGQTLAAGSILATLNVDDNVSGVGSNNLLIDRNDVFVLNLTSTGLGTTAGTATMFIDGSDVGLDDNPSAESPYALAMFDPTPVVNTAPTITNDGGGATASINVVENTTAVTTVTATDLEGDTPTFSITGGADQTLFSIDTNTGALTFNSAPNFEAPADNDSDNVYVVEVTASDGRGGTNAQTISVTVTDALELVVSNTNATGTGSLHEAILNANANTGATDTITFNIPGAGPHAINLTGPLPAITDTVIIDGTTDPDYAGDPIIQIDGSSAGAGVTGLTFTSTSDGSEVKGLLITNFTQHGIQVDSGADGITITNNWIGTTGTGSVGDGNGDTGIYIQGANTIVGGTGANDGNVITNNGNEGINVTGAGATGTIIQGNIIGLDPDGSTGSGNADVGIALLSGGDNTTIGGTTPAARNVISNNFEGIEINSNNNVVQGNYIGTDITGTENRGNDSDDGVEIKSTATGNLIGGTEAGAGNLIAFNFLDGVNVVSGTDNSVLGNVIHSNGGLGIDLGTSGVTGNDPDDADTGANDLQNFPVITQAVLSGTDLTLSGSLDTDGSNTQYRLEFYGNPAGTEDVSNGEARVYLGSVTVTTDASGNATYSNVTLSGVTLNAGDFVTATATRIDDPGQVGIDDGLAYGSTSELGANLVIAPANTAPVITSNGGGDTAGISVAENSTAVTTVAATDANADTVTYSISGGADASLFSIDTNSGVLTFISAPDFEAPTDADGNNVYEVTVQAADGNGGFDTQTIGVTVIDADEIAPVVTITNLSTADNTPQLAGTVDDPTATIEVTVNGSTYTAANNGDGTWTLADNTIAPALADGTYDVSVTATDGVGNAASDASVDELVVDTTAPVVTVTGLSTNDNTPQLTGTVSDPSATVQVTVNGTTYTATNNGDGTWTLADNTIAPALADGTYDVSVTATDGVGNAGSDASVDELVVDTTAPVVTVTGLTTADTTPQLTGTVSDPAATVQVTVNGTTYTATNNGDGTWTLADNTIAPALADGTYDVSVTATDGIGNAGTDGTVDELVVDTAAPAVTITALTTADNTPALTGTVSDPSATVQVTVNGTTYTATNNGDGTWTLANDTIAPALADGTYDVSVTVTDGLGNVGTDGSVNELTIDTTAPVVTVTGLTTADNTPQLTGTVSDPSATVQVTVNGTTYTATNNGDGTWTLANDTIAPALADGTYDVSVTATDGVGNAGTDGSVNELTIDTTAPVVTVTGLTTADNTPALTGTVSDPSATVQVTVNGTTYTATNNGDGTWTLANDTIAPALADGTYDVSVTATDGVGNAGSDASVDELVIDTTAPVVTVTSLTTADRTPELTGTVDDPAATVQVTVNGTTYAATNNGDGTWTLANDTIAPALGIGTYDVTVTATDALGNASSDASVDELVIVNTPPVAGNDTYTTDEDLPITAVLGIDDLLLNDSDAGGDPLVVNTTPVSGPSNGTLALNSDGTFTYTPDADFSGTDSFTYEISDGNGGTSQAVATIVVNPVNDPPTTSPVTLAPIAEDSGPRLITQAELLANATDVEGDALTASNLAITSGSGTLTDNGDGTWSYTPASNDDSGVSFSYTISDGAASVPASATLDITPQNDAPLAGNVTISAIEDTVYTGTLPAAGDADGDAVTYALSGAATNGTAVVNPDGSFSYAPNANFNGSDSFGYTVSDGNGGSNAYTVDIGVAPVNDTPTAGDDGLTIDEDTLSVISSANLLANDSDVDGDSLSVSVAAQPTNGSLSDNGDGTFTYTPDPNFSGTDSFTYQVADGHGGVQSAQVTIVVQPVADAPIVGDQTFTLAADAPDSTVVGTVAASDPDAGDTLTYAISGGNGGGAFAIDPGTGEITVADAAALDAASTSQVALTVAVTDSGGTTVLATITVDLTDTITPVGPELRDAIDDVDGILEPPLPAPEAPAPETPEETENGGGGGVAPVESDDSASKQQGGHGPSGVPQAGPGQPSSAKPQITNAPPAPTPTIADAPDGALAALEMVLAKTSGPGWSDWTLAGAGATAPQPTEQPPMFDALDQALQGMGDSADTLVHPTERLMIQVTMGTSISLSAGFLAWALRGGSLMASFMSTMPLWRGLDPLPVLAAHRRREDDLDPEEGRTTESESVDLLFGRPLAPA